MYRNNVSDDTVNIEQIKERLAKAEKNEMRLMHLLREYKDEISANKARINKLEDAIKARVNNGINECHITVKTDTNLGSVGIKNNCKSDIVEISEDVLLNQKAKIDELHRNLHHWKSIADERTREIQSIYRSEAWIMTWPFRKMLFFANRVFYFFKTVCRWLALKALAIVMNSKPLKDVIGKKLLKWPKLHNYLRCVAVSWGLVSMDSDGTPMPMDAYNTAFSAMTPRAKVIYLDLKYAIEKRHMLESD